MLIKRLYICVTIILLLLSACDDSRITAPSDLYILVDSVNLDIQNLSAANGKYVLKSDESLSCKLIFSSDYLSIFFSDLNHAVMKAKKLTEGGIIFSGYKKPMLSAGNFSEIEVFISENRLNEIINCRIDQGFELQIRMETETSSLVYHSVQTEKDFMIFGHRGGGSMGMSVPAPENSLEIIGLASLYGANGVEIDIRLTKDEIPILFHDENLTPRTVDGKIAMGKIFDFHYAHLEFYCRLYNGEKIPTLEMALNYILNNTTIKYVWLDCKTANIDNIMKLQITYNEKAKLIGRELTIYVGLPDEEVWQSYMNSPLRHDSPSICELSPEKTIESNSKIWSQRWTQGFSADKIDMLYNYGIETVFWPVNDKEVLGTLSSNTIAKGVITDYPQYIYELINE